jgi:hypothetical protein
LPVLLSTFLKIDTSHFSELGCFDPILDMDTRLFIDPHLLKHCKAEEFKNSYTDLQTHFKKLGRLLLNSDSKNGSM